MKRFALGLGIAALIVAGLGARSLTSVTPASAVVSASLAIDADTSDGCATIQPTNNITQGTATSVGICIVNAASAPVSGLISGATLRVTYTAPLTASNVASEGGLTPTDLNSNPDWNQATGGSWDCNVLNTGASAPTASPSPATITCESGAGSVDVPVSGNVLLATLNFNAAGSLGTSTLAFGVTDLSTGASGVNNPVCGAGFTCTGASITVQAPPTATATATATATSTPTATNTPCTVGGVACTATPSPTTSTSANRTNTPTRTSTAVATATATTGAARTATKAAGGATQPGGGAGAGGTIRLPNTGSQPSGGAGTHSWLWLTMAALAAACIGGAMALTARRHRR
ncbi:MAG: hypothetical protein M3P30_14385 [Chloroflexota bacterium]|nr:hypothetical protein [Chloroflexota bacterium]